MNRPSSPALATRRSLTGTQRRSSITASRHRTRTRPCLLISKRGTCAQDITLNCVVKDGMYFCAVKVLHDKL